MWYSQVSSASESEKKEANELRLALEQQMDQLRVAHQKQVAALRDEIAEKQQLINDIKEYVEMFIVNFYGRCFFPVQIRNCHLPNNNYSPNTRRLKRKNPKSHRSFRSSCQ